MSAWRLGAVVVVAAAALLSACTGGDEPAPAPTPTPTASTATAAAVTPACTPARPQEAGASVHRLAVDGTERGYLLHVPPGYDGTRRLPVVYLFHGLGGTADTFLPYTRLAEVANENGFLIVAPQAAGPRASWDFVPVATDDGPDAAFVRALTAEIDGTTCSDPARRYAAGMSNGSAMTFALACSGDFGFAAYGAVAGAFYAPDCEDAPAAPIVYFHGTADAIVPIDGGPTPLEDVGPAQTTLSSWAAHDDCGTTPRRSTVAAGIDLQAWQSCSDGAGVDFYRIQGTGHTWPGGLGVGQAQLGTTTQTIDAGRIMWGFFKNRRLS